MDIQALAHWAAGLLAPSLPYLLASGQKAAEEIGKEAGGDAWRASKSLWERLRPKIEARPAALEAAEDVASTPTDEDALAVLRVQLKKLLTEDEALAAEVARIYEEAKKQGVTVIAAGDRSVAIGGDASGTIITGDQNLTTKT
jgi:hypothetical protein